jgi:pimeloyl-ACP methyl ester carboxylesterase
MLTADNRGLTRAPTSALRGGSSRTASGRRVVVAVLATMALLLSIAGCSDELGEGAAVGPVPTPALAKFYAQKLNWSSCAPYDCTYLRVPMDYANPDGKIIRLAVLRHRAGDPSKRIGSLVINPGGPGQSGTAAVDGVVKELGNARVVQRFDIVGFDPRGVGSSEPPIRCYTPEEMDAERKKPTPDNSPSGVAQQLGDEKDYVAKCAQRSGVDFLANVGTRDVARDMDVLRSALGDPKLTYVGWSYGTRLGYTYAEQFPRNVRALLLDGAEDPNQTAADESLANAIGFQQAFDAFAAWCAQQKQCPLGNDPKAATANFKKLVNPKNAKPVTLDDGRELSYGDATTGTIQALYGPWDWERLRQGLTELTQGQGDTLMELADDYDGRKSDGTYSGENDDLAVIHCVDDDRITDPAAVLEESRQALAAERFADLGFGPDPIPDACAFWPVSPTSRPHQPDVAGLPQVVVVSTTGDPATPYQAGVNLARALGGRLLTAQGTQHTVALEGMSPCVDDLVTKYLTDLVLPPDGSQCKIPPGTS